MKLLIAKNKSSGDKKAFEIIKAQVMKKPGSLIGLAVGKTTDGLYKLISRDAVKNPKTWKKVKLFQIDENLRVAPNLKISFNYEIRKKLKNLLEVTNSKNIFLMDGTENPNKIIKSAYKFIHKNKGIDLIIIGIGHEYDPHIAYNTTGKSGLNSRMRVVDLHPKAIHVIVRRLEESTRQSHNVLEIASPEPALSEANVARNNIQGITLGIKDILETKKVLLIAYGKEKAKSIKLAFKGKVNSKRASASALQLHKNLEVVIDKNAGKYL